MAMSSETGADVPVPDVFPRLPRDVWGACDDDDDDNNEEDDEDDVHENHLCTLLANHAQLGQWEAARATVVNLFESTRRRRRGRRKARDGSERGGDLGRVLSALVDVVLAGSRCIDDERAGCGASLSDEEVLSAASASWRAVVLYREFSSLAAAEGVADDATSCRSPREDTGVSASTSASTNYSVQLDADAVVEAELLLLISMIGRPGLSELEYRAATDTDADTRDRERRRRSSAVSNMASCEHAVALRKFFRALRQRLRDGGRDFAASVGSVGVDEALARHLRWLASAQIRLFDSLRRVSIRVIDGGDAAIKDARADGERHDLPWAFETAAVDALERAENGIDKGISRGEEVAARLAYTSGIVHKENIQRYVGVIRRLLARGGNVMRRTMEAVLCSDCESLLSAVERSASDACLQTLRSPAAERDVAGDSSTDGGRKVYESLLQRVSGIDADTILACSEAQPAARIHFSRITKIPMSLAVAEKAKELVLDGRCDDAVRLLTDTYPELSGPVALMLWDEMRMESFRKKWALTGLLQLAVNTGRSRSGMSGACLTVVACDAILYRMRACESIARCLDSVGCGGEGRDDEMNEGSPDSERTSEICETMMSRFDNAQSPLNVVADILQHLPPRLATDLVSGWPHPPWMDPLSGGDDDETAGGGGRRAPDVEIIHMATAISETANSLYAFGTIQSKDEFSRAKRYLCRLLCSVEFHLTAIRSMYRRLWAMDFIVHMISLDSTSLKKEPIGIGIGHGKSDAEDCERFTAYASDCDDDGPSVLCIAKLVQAIRAAFDGISSTAVGDSSDGPLSSAASSRIREVGRWIDEAEWKLNLLRRVSQGRDIFATLGGTSTRHRSDKGPPNQALKDLDLEAMLTLMRASPLALTILCLRNERLDLASEIVDRHDVSRTDTADMSASSISNLVDASMARASIEGQLAQLGHDKAEPEIPPAVLVQHTDESVLPGIERAAIFLDFAMTSSISGRISRELIAQSRDLIDEHSRRLALCEASGSAIDRGVDDEDCIERSMCELYARACSLLDGLCELRGRDPVALHRVISDVEPMPEQAFPDDRWTSRSVRSAECSDDGHGGSSSGSPEISRRPDRESTAGAIMAPFVARAYADCRNLRALGVLDDFVSEKSTSQFISGALHNLAHALEDVGEESQSAMTIWSVLTEGGNFEDVPRIFHGAMGPPTPPSANGSPVVASARVKAAHPFYSSQGLSLSHLSRMLRYIANLGDIVASVEGTVDGMNHLKVLEREPDSILSYIVFEKGNFQAAMKAADVMNADLLQAILPLFINPIHPPLYDTGDGQRDGSLKRAPRGRVLTKKRALQLIRHLAAQSPLRALLACSFGLLPTTLEQDGKDGDEGGTEQLEEQILSFTLEQSSSNYPVLHEFIQMQSRSFALQTQPTAADELVGGASSDEGDDLEQRNAGGDDSGNDHADTAMVKAERAGHDVRDGAVRDAPFMAKERLMGMPHPDYMAIWEDGGPYLMKAFSMVSEGKLMDALDVADNWIMDGAPDDLLAQIINKEFSIEMIDGPHDISWTCCMRLRDFMLAARYILLYHSHWQLPQAIAALQHVLANFRERGSDAATIEAIAGREEDGDDDELKLESIILTRLTLLRRFAMLTSVSKGSDWARDALRWDKYPVDFAQELAESGCFHEALRLLVERKYGSEERRHLTVSHLKRLLQDGFLNSSEVTQIISELPTADAWSAVRVVLQETRSRRLRLFLISTIEVSVSNDPDATADIVDAIDRARTGYRVLAMLTTAWAQRTASLAERPELILEMLLMGQQLSTAKKLLEKFPALRDDVVVLQYVEKALMAWRTNGAKAAGGEKLEDDGSEICSEDTDGEFDRLSARFDSVADSTVMHGRGLVLPDVPCLTGDSIHDNQIRLRHRYEMTPNTSLAIALLELIPDAHFASTYVVSLCRKLALKSLSLDQLPEHNSTAEHLETANAACDAISDLLSWSSRACAAQEQQQEEEDGDAGGDGQQHGQADVDRLQLQRQIDLLSILLKKGVHATIEDVEDCESVRRLQERLAEDEYYNLAIFVGSHLGVSVDTSWIWKRWGIECLRVGAWTSARTKIARSLEPMCPSGVGVAGPPGGVVEGTVREIIAAIEEGESIDLSQLRQEYADIVQSSHRTTTMSIVGTILGMIDVTRSSSSSTTEAAISSASKQRRSREKYEECSYYIRKYCPRIILEFAVRNDELGDAVCSIPDLVRGEVDEKDVIGELCSYCISRSVGTDLLLEFNQLEQATRDRYTKLACEYLARNGHISLLYDYQISLCDFHAAALSCLQLYWNSETTQSALQYLENAQKLLDIALENNHSRGASSLSSSSTTTIAGADGNGATVRRAGVGVRRKDSASDSTILRLSARVRLQVDILRAAALASEPLTVLNILGSDGSSAMERRKRVAQMITHFDFDLSFRIVSEFKLNTVEVFGGAADEFVTQNNVGDVVALMENIRGIVSEEERDAIIERCISLYIQKDSQESTVSFGFQRFTSSQWQSAVYRVLSAKRLAALLSTTRRQVLGMIACGDLKSAFDIGSGAASVDDVQLVEAEAKHTDSKAVAQACARWLEEHAT